MALDHRQEGRDHLVPELRELRPEVLERHGGAARSSLPDPTELPTLTLRARPRRRGLPAASHG